MQKRITITYTNPSFELEISLKWHLKTPTLFISMKDDSGQNSIKFQCYTKSDVAKVLIFLSSEYDGTLLKELRTGDFILTSACYNNNLLTGNQSVLIASWNEFLKLFKEINVWVYIQETGYHELLPEK